MLQQQQELLLQLAQEGTTLVLQGDDEGRDGLEGCGRTVLHSLFSVSRAVADNADLDEVQHVTRELLACANEKFYAHHYSSVARCWRRLYCDASVVQAAAQMQRLERPEMLQALVTTLDRCIIMVDAPGYGRREWIERVWQWLRTEQGDNEWFNVDSEETGTKSEENFCPGTNVAFTRYTGVSPEMGDRQLLKRKSGSPERERRRSLRYVDRDDCRTYLKHEETCRVDSEAEGPPERIGHARLALCRGLSVPVMEFPEPYMLQHYLQSRHPGELSPLRIRGLCDDWPALWRWPHISYWMHRTLGGCRLVPVELGSKYTDDSWTQKLMPMRDFLHDYILHAADAPRIGYVAQHSLFSQIHGFEADFDVERFAFIDTYTSETSRRLVMPIVNVWLGPPGTYSPCHWDGYYNLLHQVVGRKRVRLFPPSVSEAMEPQTSHAGLAATSATHNTAARDPGPVRQEEELNSALLEQRCDLEPGDTLLIPPGWWHSVEALPSPLPGTLVASVNVWFD